MDPASRFPGTTGHNLSSPVANAPNCAFAR
jgi:hypothetical protein